ncbi:MAG: hypothetical protein ACKOAZ_03100, partial [Ilumatobacteraceae bacterium]
MPQVPAEMCLPPRELFEPRLGPGCVVYGVVEGGMAHLAVCPLPLGSGEARRLADSPPIRPARSLGGGSWCLTHDRSAVVYLAVDGDLWLQGLDGSPARRLTSTGPDRSLSGPVALVDGRSVAFVAEMAEVWVVDLGDLSVRRLDDGRDSFVLDVCAVPVLDDGAAPAAWTA